jgi:formyl-CoA transferase
MDEVFADPQVKHMGISAPVKHPKLGTLNLISQPVRLSRTPATLKTATPERGEHTEEVLLEIGYTKEDVNSFKKEGIV